MNKFDMVKVSHKVPSSFSDPMNVVVDMSSLDLAILAFVMRILPSFRCRYESKPPEPEPVERQPVESKPHGPPQIPPFKFSITPPSTPVEESTNRESGEVSSSTAAVSHQAETEKKEPSSSPRSFPLRRYSSKKAEDAALPSPLPSLNSKKYIKSSASIQSDTAGKPIKIRSTQEDSAFNSFKRLCEAHGLLQRPVRLASMMGLMESMMRLSFRTCLVPSLELSPLD